MSKVFGLIGYPLSHSFSKKYFSEKFKNENINDCRYELFPIEQIEQLPSLINTQANLKGLNVTIPYKELVIPFLDELDEGAAKVGAVNTIKFQDGQLKGYNTDVFGFKSSLLSFIGNTKTPNTLVLGTGGAAKAVAYVVEQLGCSFRYVSRKADKGHLTYQDLFDQQLLKKYQLIINTTPLGMSPYVNNCPNIPYEQLNQQHFLFDLVYNPTESLFLKKGKAQGSAIMNGMDMLIGQAEKSWEIWQCKKHINERPR